RRMGPRRRRRWADLRRAACRRRAARRVHHAVAPGCARLVRAAAALLCGQRGRRTAGPGHAVSRVSLTAVVAPARRTSWANGRTLCQTGADTRRRGWSKRMTTKDIGVDRDGFVATIEIRRPPHNYFDVALINEIADALDALDADETCRAVVLAAQGKSFCAGANFGDGSTLDAAGKRPGEALSPIAPLYTHA